MNKALERYWLEERKFFKRDLKAGHAEASDLKVFWDDKVEDRSKEIDPSATFSSYYEFVTSGGKKVVKKTSKKTAKKKRAKKTSKRRSWWFW